MGLIFFCLTHGTIVPHQKEIHDILILGKKLNETTCKELATQQGAWTAAQDQTLFQVINYGFRTYIQQFRSFFHMEMKDTGFAHVTRNTSHESTPDWFLDNSTHVLAAVLFLNSDVAGGELGFTRQREIVEPRCGTLVVFPNHYLYMSHWKPIRLGTVHFVATYLY